MSEIGGVARVNANLNLSRAIGDLRYKTNRALSPSEQIITAEPDVTVTELTHEHEFLVMACDGVWDVMKNQEVRESVCGCEWQCGTSCHQELLRWWTLCVTSCRMRSPPSTLPPQPPPGGGLCA